MNFRTFEVHGILEITPVKHADERGYLSEIFRQDVFRSEVADVEFLQENQSLSIRPGTIRGVHFQTHPYAQGKLVRCLAGSLLDIAVDLRHGSATFGHSVPIVLTAEQNNQFWVPVGFGHAFCTLEPNSVISYRVTNYYSAANDMGLAWDDPQLAIEWPAIADPETLSAKDRRLPRLQELPAYFSVDD